MISNRTLRQWFRQQISDSSSFDLSDFAWENRQFDGGGKDLFFEERLTVVEERITTNEESAKWGIMFYDVIVTRGKGSEAQDDAAETLADIFEPANNKDILIESGLKIDIDVASVDSLVEYDKSRAYLPVRIEFRAYETTSLPVTYNWTLPAGTTQMGYFFKETIDAATFFDDITSNTSNLIRWVEPITQGVKEFYYSPFPTPEWVNEIGDVEPGYGFIAILASPIVITYTGYIQAQTSHQLKTGTNLLAYGSATEIDAQVAFQELIDAGVLTKVTWVDPDTLVTKELYDSGGWINDIGNLKRGQGYQVIVTSNYGNFVL